VLLTGYQAAKYLKRTVQISAAVMVINIAFAFGLSRLIGHLGIAAANTISQMVQTVLLIWFINEIAINRLISLEVAVSFAKNFGISIFMLVLLLFVKRQALAYHLPPPVTLPLLIIIGLVSFSLSAFILKSQELNELIQLFTKRSKSDRSE
jgi:peptidoglycan biosynthesis protein MviN/MurJ (putative lipid II flippase)